VYIYIIYISYSPNSLLLGVLNSFLRGVRPRVTGGVRLIECLPAQFASNHMSPNCLGSMVLQHEYIVYIHTLYQYTYIYIYYHIILLYIILYHIILYYIRLFYIILYIYIIYIYNISVYKQDSIARPIIPAHSTLHFAGVYLLAPFAAALATGPCALAAARRQRCAGTVQLSSRTLVGHNRRWWKCQKLQEDHVV